MTNAERGSPTLGRRLFPSRNIRFYFIVTTAVMLLLISSCYVYFDATNFLSGHLVRVGKSFVNAFQKSVISNDIDSPPIILLWTPYFSNGGNWLPPLSSSGCPEIDCIITANRNLLNVSAAVVFHWRNVNISNLPEQRYPNQRWVLFNKEAPPHTPEHVLKALSGKINWTITYRKDSDIYAPYGSFVRRRVSVPAQKPPGDRRLVCWLVSNCETPSRREKFVDLLKEFIPVDVYGKCGDLSCPTNNKINCYSVLSRRCKFYLSFENSICRDYATEKVYNALKTSMVPVVMGGEDYRTVLPPNSFIDAQSFSGPKELAKYLLALDKDEERYLSYLEWKKDYEVQDVSYHWSCELCRKLRRRDSSKKRGDDLLSWWFHNSCISGFESSGSSLLADLFET